MDIYLSYFYEHFYNYYPSINFDLACPCENGQVCLGTDEDENGQEDCGEATGSKLLWQLDGISEHHNNKNNLRRIL